MFGEVYFLSWVWCGPHTLYFLYFIFLINFHVIAND